ncbi:MAG: sigma-70 family RNA polymerase sigma factor [Pseudomonadota bacterium]
MSAHDSTKTIKAQHAPKRAALADLYANHAPVVSASIRRRFGDGPPDPDDITQLAFQKLLERNRPDEILNPQAFLLSTAKNLVLTEKRNQGVRTRYEPDVEEKFFTDRGDSLDPQRVVIAKEQLRLINQALDQMPRKRRRAFLLHRVEGLTVSEVGRRLDISRSAAQKHLVKAFAQIDTLLTDS